MYEKVKEMLTSKVLYLELLRTNSKGIYELRLRVFMN